MKKLKKFYYGMYEMPESMVTFVSGIFISVSTGIFTCNIPESLASIGAYYIWSAVLMFIASLALMLWAIVVSPLQKDYENNPFEGKNADCDWVTYITDKDRKADRIKLHLCFIITVITVVLSVVLWAIA